MKTVTARVLDATHLELSQPIAMQQGQTILISVVESACNDPERQQWLAFSSENLSDAYSDSEPEYLDSMVKESNPEYRA
ncbi:MAG: hypothetical protein K1Y02_19790 [Candidatus Hydrogenedentes bacterium]|nr:hypothetical protein [Candidatus Hydrogenedentota bacterium]